MRYVFGEYSLDPTHYELRQAGRLVPVEPRVFEVLAYLVQHAGQTVTTEELLAQLYPQQFAPVERLTNAVTHARKVLGETSQAPRYIQTVRRRGYRFLAPVEVRQTAETDPSDLPPPDRLSTVEPPRLDQTGAAGPAAPSQVALPSASPAVPVREHGPGAAGADRRPAERRHLTVLFCDLVDSTRLAGQLDPEDLREVIHAYHGCCTAVIQRFDGYIAQYLGDGLLVYFGYPLAHEDDAQRAVRAGLGIVEALGQLNTRLTQERGVQLAVRLGVHTGLVVVGEVGGGTRQEQLALGETPHIAARLQEVAAPNTLVISAATLPLLGGFFACQPLGTPRLKGLTQPLAVYRVLYESMARSRLEAAGSAGLTPLVGREQEIRLLLERWAQVKDGLGQVVLLSGEAGIGKSRLVQVLKEQAATEAQAWLTPCQCSPYYQNTALHPWIDLLERVALRFDREHTLPQKLSKLEGFLVQYGLPLAEAVPLFAALLSLPLTAEYAPLTLSPEQLKQRTLHALLTILLRIAAQQPVLLVMEDLHWVDPSTLELLSLLVDQGPTARILTLLTFRPDFRPPWIGRSHCTQVTLHRLTHPQATELMRRVAHHKALPPEVVEQIVAKTDGVPLFVEELTKMVLESDLLEEREEDYALTGPLPPLAIPATLHDSLMARLDRLAPVKALAQLGATLGREFSYELLQAVSPWDEETLHRGLHQLVEAEFLYQRGLPPQATYLFKHALIQDTAYQSLLRSTRQQYHQRIAQVVEARFPEICETQPELLAHHYTEAGRTEQAITYWQRAGQHASDRAAFGEARAAFEQALQALTHLPESSATRMLALDLRLAADSPLIALGENERRLSLLGEAEALARALDDRARLGRVLARMAQALRITGDLDGAMAAGQQALKLAAELGDSALQGQASYVLGQVHYAIGDFGRAAALLRRNVEAADQSADTPSIDVWHRSQAWLSRALGALGEFAEGRRYGEEVLHLATLEGRGTTPVTAHGCLGNLYLVQGDLGHAIRVLKQGLTLCHASGNRAQLRLTTAALGYASALQGRLAEGRALLEEAISESLRTGAWQNHSLWVAWLSEVCRLAGHGEEAWQHASRALDLARQHKERANEARALHQLGVVHTQTDPPDTAQAAVHYCQALTLAEELGMRPLQAHCHRGLGTLYATLGQREQARTALSTAIQLYRAMEMTFWLPETEAALAQVDGR